jgi:type I restriction enzyme S subunit
MKHDLELTEIGALAPVVTGRTPSVSDATLWGNEIEFVTPADFEENGSLRRSYRMLSRAGRSIAQIVPAHSVVFVGIGATLGKTAVVDREIAVNQQCHAVLLGNERDAVLLREIIAQSRHLFWRRAGNGGMPILPKAVFQQVEIPWPSEPVRAAIYRSLSVLTELQSGAEHLIEAKRIFKRGLMQRLLAGRSRFPEFRARQWDMHRFDYLCEELSERNGKLLGSDSVMGVIKGIGLQPMRDRVRGKGNLTRYKVVPPGAFAYNPMRLNIGSIAYNDLGRTILVSPDYEVFQARPGIANPDYINELRYSSYWSSFMDRAGAGSVRVRIYFRDLARLRVPAPEFDEQARIAEVLRLATLETDQLARLRELIKNQKHALLSKLLSGDLLVSA